MASYPQITIDNKLAGPVSVYDAFVDNTNDTSLANYFGTLTSLGSVGAANVTAFTPIHGPISTYILYDSQNTPVKRVFTLGTAPQTFEVNQADLDVIATTQNFVKLMQDSPTHPLVQQFNVLIKGGKSSAQDVDAFFRNSADYSTCSYISYMLVMVALARTPATRNLPPDQQRYSLSTLLQYMGIDWPSGLPDIILSKFFCSQANQRIQLGGQLTLSDITFDSGVLDHVLAILPSPTLRFTVVVDLEPGLAVGSTQLQCLFDNLSIPIGGSSTIELDKPTVMLSLLPLFKFVVFEIKAIMPFSLFNSPTFNAIAAMTIDNVEAEIGVTLDGNDHTLLTPPGIKGLHFDQFGVGMGLFFEPPGFALGVQGKFHIGEGNQVVQLDDDTFAVVCALQGEVPNPLYLAFYVPQLSLMQVITLFTDQACNIDVPVQFSDLSLHWAENPMEPVTLPDGSLAPMGYGFSAAMDLFGLGFYADLSIDLNNGVQGKAELAPFSFGPVFSLSGDGSGVSIKVDASGNPIANNTIPRSAAAKQAIDQATSKQLVAPGGAQLQISTSNSPYFKLDARLAFLGFHDSIDATIDKNGIRFSLDYGAIISGTMACVLKDFHNFSGQFAYGPNFDIPLPTIAGLSLGHINLTAQIDTTLGLSTSTSNLVFSAAGGFDFEGLTCTIGPFDLDIDISGLSDVLAAIEHWVLNNVQQLFAGLLGDAGRWAQAVYSNAILPAVQGAEYVVNVLKNAFGKTLDEIGYLLRGSTYALDEVANALRSTFGAAASDVAGALTTAYQATDQEVAKALQAAGYAADQIASALKSVFDLTGNAAATVLNGLGYGADQVASALSTAYGASSQAVASALRGVGYGAEATARALSDVFNLAPDAVNTVLQGAGYAASEVESAFNTIGGAFASFAQSTWDTVTHYADPSNW
ncbi:MULTISPECIES: hypothetical protein [unclassified Pseudomonas]|uniref:hypothetical protein n=1 Tax=unclassified Pseudomonas TaxID=196821 RepID=UPI001E472899|nr:MULTISPECIES: hypothetical protein [unclassified Pseudomonas]MCE0915820.1 hypothetical protein [Pseudomonas sp. NMI760_13]MCP8632085.1 hypothetical protein [Pseudomonas sp. DVZ6]MDC0687069.1 hypothetical protein [Mitsuaria sp. RG]MDD7783085.1 hypothetical protein [Pseudomonas sp. DVZ24]